MGTPDQCAAPVLCTQPAVGLGLTGVGGTRVWESREGCIGFWGRKLKSRKQKGKAIQAKLPQLLLIFENNKEIDLTLLHPSLSPSGLCFYFPEPVMIKAKGLSIAVFFPFHSKQKLQRLQCFISGLSWTSGLLQTELFARAASPMVSVTSSAHCRGKKAPPRQGRKKEIHTLLVECSLSKQILWL